MPQISKNFTQLTDLDPVLTEIFYQQYEQVQPVGQMVFNMLTSDKSKETDLRIGSFRDPREFEGAVEYQTVLPDYEITYTHTEYADGFIVERKLFDDMQYGPIFASASEMGTAFGRKREKDRAGVFNNAFTAGGTAGYDGVALVSASHPRSKSDATTVSNTLTLALDSENLNTAIITQQAFKDAEGEEISIMGNLLIVPRALRKVAHELTESELTPESAENASNIHMGMQYVVWPFLTDSNAWFVVDTTLAKRYLKWYDRIGTEFGAEQDFDTFQRKYRGYMRYSKGWSDWRWIIGSNPS